MGDAYGWQLGDELPWVGLAAYQECTPASEGPSVQGCRMQGGIIGSLQLPIMMPTIVKTADHADSAAVCSDVIQGPCS